MSGSNESASGLARVPLFRHVEPIALTRLEQQSWTRRYPDGQILTSEGDPGDSLLVLERGQVKISRFSPSGHEVVLALVEAPEAIGELALIDGAPRSATITAMSAVEVRVLPRQAFLDLIHSEPQTMMMVLRAVTAMVRATNERLSDLLSLDVPGRVAKWLLVRGASRGAQDLRGIVIPFEQSQRELGNELGTTRVSVNKALKMFESLGAIELGRDEIIIRKSELLLDFTY